MLITMIVLFSGVTTFCFFDITQDGGKGIVNMILIYFIGRYIRMYKDDVAYKKTEIFGIYIIITVCCIMLNAGIYIVTGSVQNRFARDNSLFTIAEAVCIFMIFKSVHFKNNFINKLATHVPAVFIMEWTLRGVITHYMFDYLAWRENNWHEIILLAIAVLLFVIGTCVDTIRIKIFGTLEEKLVCILMKMFANIKKIILSKLIYK